MTNSGNRRINDQPCSLNFSVNSHFKKKTEICFDWFLFFLFWLWNQLWEIKCSIRRINNAEIASWIEPYLVGYMRRQVVVWIGRIAVSLIVLKCYDSPKLICFHQLYPARNSLLFRSERFEFVEFVTLQLNKDSFFFNNFTNPIRYYWTTFSLHLYKCWPCRRRNPAGPTPFQSYISIKRW